jgi:gluconokinase
VIIVLMGVSGSGKTTVGTLLADRLGWRFYDGDQFHPQANIDKMAAGKPLTEADRVPWLAALHTAIDNLVASGESAVVACSALTLLDRQQLTRGERGVRLVYLHGDYDLIRRRLEARHGHFFHADLLASQFATLQEPTDVFSVDVAATPAEIVDEIIKGLGLALG